MTATRSPGGRRSAYRVRPTSVHELDLALLEKRYRVIRGRIADIAAGGAQVEFERGSIPVLTAGERVMLALASDVHDFDGTLWAYIVASTVHPDGHVVRFAFDPGNAPLKADDETLFRVFNRRQAYRASAAGAAPAPIARVARSAHGAGHAVALRDLSVRGVCFGVPRRADRALREHAELVLALSLPAAPDTHRIACRPLRRTVGPDEVVYACALDWPASVAATAGAAAVVAHVAPRQAQDPRLVPDRRTAG
jgi:hypothetical protein